MTARRRDEATPAARSSGIRERNPRLVVWNPDEQAIGALPLTRLEAHDSRAGTEAGDRPADPP
jgi:hypothetical protein